LKHRKSVASIADDRSHDRKTGSESGLAIRQKSRFGRRRMCQLVHNSENFLFAKNRDSESERIGFMR